MTTETTLSDLRTLASERPEAAQALADLERTIAAQALIIRALSIDLRNRRVSQAHMDALVSNIAIGSVVGTPARTDFTLAEAQQAAGDLVTEANRSRSAAAFLTTLVKLIRVFV